VDLERGPFSLVSTIEVLLGRKSSISGLEIWEYGSRIPLRWPRGTLYQQKLALTSPTSGSRSVDTVRSRTKATEFSYMKESLHLCIPGSIPLKYIIIRFHLRRFAIRWSPLEHKPNAETGSTNTREVFLCQTLICE
jgi:hypothetical protein